MNERAAKLFRSMKFASGITLEIVQGDITHMQVDAIVNAANKHLRHGGGVAGVISQRGGPAIQQESDAWIAEKGPIDFGAPAFTSGGSLPCKYVIHAVGPVWGEGDEDEKLSQTISGVLHLSEKMHITSIAFPAISTGIFGFPVDRAAIIFIKAFDRILSSAKPAYPARVMMVLFDNTSLISFTNAFDAYNWNKEI